MGVQVEVCVDRSVCSVGWRPVAPSSRQRGPRGSGCRYHGEALDRKKTKSQVCAHLVVEEVELSYAEEEKRRLINCLTESV